MDNFELLKINNHRPFPKANIINPSQKMGNCIVLSKTFKKLLVFSFTLILLQIMYLKILLDEIALSAQIKLIIMYL